MKVAVVYWSGTGNTEKMADCIAEGIENAGSEVEVIFCDDFGADMLNDYDLVAFGCPAMGDEVLEESSFEPMFEEVEEEFKKMADAYKMEVEKIKELLGDRELEQMKKDMAVQKAVTLVADEAKEA